jgi:hypothetical protein
VAIEGQIESPSSEAVGTSSIAEVLESLRLRSEPHPGCPRALVLRPSTGIVPIAVLLEQGSGLRGDRESIEAIKAADRDLPIIYVARAASARRETAIRRLCIHYFLAEPVEKDELRLVLGVLVRAAASNGQHAQSFERFFTR